MINSIHLLDRRYPLGSGTDNNLAHINIGRLLDRQRDGAGWPPPSSIRVRLPTALNTRFSRYREGKRE